MKRHATTLLDLTADEAAAAMRTARRIALAIQASCELDKRIFAPHITLLREGRRRVETADVTPIRWPVSEYVLVRSELNEGGSRHSAVARFPL